jgi:hypothetical protein
MTTEAIIEVLKMECAMRAHPHPLELQCGKRYTEAPASMKLMPEAIKEFQEIAKGEYGVDLGEGDATVMGMRLLLLYELISQPFLDEQHPAQFSAVPPPPGHARATS